MGSMSDSSCIYCMFVSCGHSVELLNAAFHLRSVVILRSRLLVYSAGSGVNKVQVVLSGFSVSLLCCYV